MSMRKFIIERLDFYSKHTVNHSHGICLWLDGQVTAAIDAGAVESNVDAHGRADEIDVYDLVSAAITYINAIDGEAAEGPVNGDMYLQAASGQSLYRQLWAQRIRDLIYTRVLRITEQGIVVRGPDWQVVEGCLSRTGEEPL